VTARTVSAHQTPVWRLGSSRHGICGVATVDGLYPFHRGLTLFRDEEADRRRKLVALGSYGHSCMRMGITRRTRGRV